jgi:protein arginine N-methyltransferase 1
VRRDELCFESSFELVAQRSDYVHAFVCYFDIEFSHTHRLIRFSTGPFAPYTHWKQSVFYFEESIPMNAQEKLSGFFGCKQNKHNYRNLDLTISYLFHGRDYDCSESREYRMC